MIRSLAVAAVIAVITPLAFAQSARNAAYFELGGSAIVPSVNYERRLTDRWYGRGGLSWVTSDSTDGGARRTTFVIPLTVSSVNRPQANHHLELGGGLTIATGDRQALYDYSDIHEKFSSLFATGIVGYRYQKPAGGFQFRATFTPVADSGGVLPWFGVSFGYAW